MSDSFCIAVPFSFDLFRCTLAIEMWPNDFYDFLAQIDGDYE
jgi:hypothetical protein